MSSLASYEIVRFTALFKKFRVIVRVRALLKTFSITVVHMLCARIVETDTMDSRTFSKLETCREGPWCKHFLPVVLMM